MSEKKYNHAFTIAFSIDTDAPCEDSENIPGDYPTEDELLRALLKRVENLKDNPMEIYEAIGAPYDTYENY